MSAQRKVAVITGASSGIGEATARALVTAGYRVALLARRADRINELAAELGDDALAIEADVTDRDSLVAAAERVQTELGGADILVNNAGLMLLGPFSSEQRDDYRRMVETNLLGAITTTEVSLDHSGRRRRPDQHPRSQAEQPARQTPSTPRPSGAQRLVGIAAPGTPTRDPRHRDRARRRRHRADKPHHPRQTREATEAFVKELAIRPEDIAEVIVFASRAREG